MTSGLDSSGPLADTAQYGANSARQQLSILADNLARHFQLYGAAKLPDLRFDDLRHTFASRLAMTQRLFAQIIRRIERLGWHPT